MAPPGRPNITSTCCISKLLISACAPVTSIGAPLWCLACCAVSVRWCVGGSVWPGSGSIPSRDMKTTSRLGGRRAHGERVSCALRNEYQNAVADGVVRHDPAIVAQRRWADKGRSGPPSRRTCPVAQPPGGARWCHAPAHPDRDLSRRHRHRRRGDRLHRRPRRLGDRSGPARGPEHRPVLPAHRGPGRQPALRCRGVRPSVLRSGRPAAARLEPPRHRRPPARGGAGEQGGPLPGRPPPPVAPR